MDAHLYQSLNGEDLVAVHMTSEEAACIAAALSFPPTADLLRQTSYWEDVESLVQVLRTAED